MQFDLSYDDEKFLDLTIVPGMREDPDILHDYANRLKIKNPAVGFADMARAGLFNEMSDEDYDNALRRMKLVSTFFNSKSEANVFHVLAEAMKYILSSQSGDERLPL